MYGLAVAFVASLIYAGKLWDIISDPAVEALKHLKVDPPQLAQLTPMESFSIIWVKLPLLCSVFIASPWIVYQVWAFISPGLYNKERRWAMPFVLITAGLFITGRTFRLLPGIPLRSRISARHRNEQQCPSGGLDHRILRSVRQCDAGRGAGVRVAGTDLPADPAACGLAAFSLQHSRYAILIIVIAAAIITPTPDVFNLMLFAIPMCALYFVGVFLSYLIVLRREGQKFPWRQAAKIVLIAVAVLAILYGLVSFFHLHFLREWPFIKR